MTSPTPTNGSRPDGPDLSPADGGAHTFTRRAVLAGAGAAGAVAFAPGSVAQAHPPAGTGGGCRVLVGGVPARVGVYAFPDDVPSLVLDNGLVRFTFGRDDAGGILTGWTDTSITATSVVVDGVELAHDLNGVDPRDPDRQHSFYVDASGGRTRLVCSEVQVLRSSPELVEVVFADTTGTPLRHEHHLIMRRRVRGLFGYVVTTATEATTINELRMNTRWDRSVLDHVYTGERGAGQQPTYAYLDTQTRIQDETWQVDGVNNPDLPSPDSNSGNLPAGSVYTKYDWSLYHHENPFFGHFGHGVGAWFTSLGGVTDQTLCASYGVGPQHQDLAVHQDALILNYFGANHYGLPSYDLQAGYRRLYGPWLTFFTTGRSAAKVTAAAADVAAEQIRANRGGCAWIDDPLYPVSDRRSTVTGRLVLSDGRPAADFWVVLSTQLSDEVYPIHEPTYFVRTQADGSFSIPGVPPAWQPGTTAPGSYTLYAFAGAGSVTQQYRQTGIVLTRGHHHLGRITWTPAPPTTFLWQVGAASRTAGEFADATHSPSKPMPRGYRKPDLLPGDLTFTIGQDWEPDDWYYAQTNPGTWTIGFTLSRGYSGTANLVVSTAMQQGSRPTVAVNGDPSVVTGTLPTNNDSTIARQADRSGYPRIAVLTFPSEVLRVGENTITFTHGSARPGGSGPGWDTIVLEVDEDTPPVGRAKLAATVRPVRHHRRLGRRVTVTNTGDREARDVRITAVTRRAMQHGDAKISVVGRDPNAFPVPIVESLAPGESASADLTLSSPRAVVVAVSADGGRVRTGAAG